VHARGVFHRHLQPSNLILRGEGVRTEAVLTDFGLASDDLLESSLQALPLTAVQYLSPEQTGLVSVDIGPASDLYAVGVLLFECLSGEPPFQGSTLGELLRQHLTVSPELRARGVHVPRALEQAVQHFLVKDPWECYQSAPPSIRPPSAGQPPS
jgi:serine/threonine protein kinase